MSDLHDSRKRGLARLVSAFRNSMAGFAAVWQEPAFRQESALALVLVPAAFWVGQSWVEVALLCALVLLVLVVEILNSAIEAVVDRVGPEWHALSKSAKDMGSAAVLLSLLLCALVWGWAIYERLTA
ncbi:diacylglycerol kinase [Corticibacter populi]|uniref:Diacylglycerol kinase n=1 Tax=Corticibacter populi TaxID=1550736 RepID=A0A3M6QXB2_9BURK|nr:diacylglycerol kinase [Corticibacter populi]RMX07660.1 diacylglycerol kinase [Corticibacter populi]RZS30165.1 diacylglycerol kinase (ATP) [Corticibacter populi]